ncbi:hypothetical protein WNX13_10315, partial [Lactobacillus delbrueckii]|uniref:hypothetical protein n=1 Tax=Lactobacillus delbrueckii TaxID=1584 RepID=UPI0030E99A0A
DMRLLEQRFRYARACAERHAWRALVQQQLAQPLDTAGLRQACERIEATLREEGDRLDAFFAAIVRANEPSVSPSGPPVELDAIRQH